MQVQQVQQSQEVQKLPTVPVPAVTSLSSGLQQPVVTFKVRVKTFSEKVIDMYC